MIIVDYVINVLDNCYMIASIGNDSLDPMTNIHTKIFLFL